MIINKDYNTKYVCKYYLDDLFTSYKNNVKKEEQDNVRDILYQADLLSIFKIEELNEELISTKIDQIYDIVKEENEFNNCITQISNLYLTNEKTGFMFLYSYDYMYLTHKCVSEYLENEKMSQNNIYNLTNKIEKL